MEAKDSKTKKEHMNLDEWNELSMWTPSLQVLFSLE
jgi:hypothetical protein